MASDGSSARGFTPADLLRPQAFAHPVEALQLRETNLSWVILTGPFAYKIKKPVKLDFVDMSTLPKRRALCEDELRLNRRLAAELYVDVVAITRRADGLHAGGPGPIVEYAVRMRQFAAAEELSALLDRAEVREQEIVDLAGRLAQFHEAAPAAGPNPDYPHTQDLRDAVLRNLATLLAHLDAGAAPSELRLLVDWTRATLRDSLGALREREASGFIRECHGDLHARNVVRWRAQLLAFDCLEFDPRLRWIDVMSDVAFLVMDLSAHARKDLAFSFLNAYLARTGDYHGVRHLPFYAVYRALVRAMVDSLGAQQDPEHRQALHDRLQMRIKTAAAFADRSAPTLIIMHGLSGSGKSWLSERLAMRLGALRIRSDVERKRLAGVATSAVQAVVAPVSAAPAFDPSPRWEEGMYRPEFSRRTYARLLDCAQSCLNAGLPTIVDAAFLLAAERSAFGDLAQRHALRFMIVACESDRATLARRIEKRRLSRLDPSDAGLGVLERQLETVQPLDAEERSHALVVDTTDPLASEAALAALQERLGSWIP